MKDVIFLTGATGILGGASLAQLLNEEKNQEIRLLIRAKNFEEAKQRVVSKLLGYGITRLNFENKEDKNYLSLVVVKDMKDLSEKDLKGVTKIIHLAANTSFLKDPSIFSINVEGTRHLASCAEKISTLKRFLYVGTAFICGDGRNKVILEEDYPRLEADHLVDYTLSKSIAETMLRTEFSLPLVVARPSIIVGDKDLGVKLSTSIFWVFSAIEKIKKISFPLETKIDVVPGDWVAKCLVTLLHKEKLLYDCYHLSAGESSSVSFKDIENLYNKEKIVKDSYEVVDELRAEECRIVDEKKAEKVKMALEIYYKFARTGIIFSNKRLMEENLFPSTPFTAYLSTCIKTSEESILEQMRKDG